MRKKRIIFLELQRPTLHALGHNDNNINNVYLAHIDMFTFDFCILNTVWIDILFVVI